MALSVLDLKPGDRVVLNCPKARGQQKREAQFRGVYRSVAEAMQDGGDEILLVPGTEEFLAGEGWAAFLLQTANGPSQVMEYPGGGPVAGLPSFAGVTQLIAAFLIEPDGSLREEQGRRVFIERRLVAGRG